MAKLIRIVASLLFLILTVNCVPAIDRNDPTLEIIKHEDAEEGYFPQINENLVCQDPKTPDNTVKTISGDPPHMSSKVEVTCDEGKHFIGSNKTTISVMCNPLPHPCMCMAAWEKLDDFMLVYNFNCTSDRTENEINPINTNAQNEKTRKNIISERSPTDDDELEAENIEHGLETESTISDEELDNRIQEYSEEKEINPETSDVETNDEEPEFENYIEHSLTPNDIESEIESNPDLEVEEEQRNGENDEPFIELNDEEQETQDRNEQEEVEEGVEGEHLEEIYEQEPEFEESEHLEMEEENESNNEIEEEHYAEETEEEITFEPNMEEESDDGTYEHLDEVENEIESDNFEVEVTEDIQTDVEYNIQQAWYEGEAEETDEEEEEEYDEHENEELTMYSSWEDNESVDPPEELNIVQLYPVEATENKAKLQEDATCLLPPVTGPCKAYYRRYFFNFKTGECETFTYGGCQGNTNNFHEINECENTCRGNIHS